MISSVKLPSAPLLIYILFPILVSGTEATDNQFVFNKVLFGSFMGPSLLHSAHEDAQARNGL